MIVEFRFRSGSAAEWLTSNPVLSRAEPGYEVDSKRLKLGDGATPWADLPYAYLDPADIALATGAADDAIAAAAAAQTARGQVDTLVAEIEGFAGVSDAVVGPLFANPASGTRGNADKVYRRGISVKDPQFGATGNGTTDDSAAIRAAISAAATFGMITYIPEGTYIVSEEGTTLGCLNLPSGAWLSGSGTIKAAASIRTGLRPIQNDGVTNVRIDGIVVDNTLNTGGYGSHCIQNNDSSHVYINRVKCLAGTHGGISIMGAMNHVRITESEIYSPTFNGVTFYGSDSVGQANPLEADDIVIDKCHIEAFVQPIDSEPVGGFAKNVRITNNTLIVTDPIGNFAITMTAGIGTGSGTQFYNEKWTVTGNTCIGAIAAFSCKDSIISDNTFDCRSFTLVGRTPYVMQANFGSSGNTVSNNKFWSGPGEQQGIGLIYSSSGGNVGRPVDWIVEGNEIHVQGTGATTSIGINASSCGPVVIRGNLIRGTNSGIGVWVRGSTAGQPVESAIVANNDIDGFARGIYGHYFAEIVKMLTIIGNNIRQTTASPTLTGGIVLSGTSAQLPQVTISGNNVDSVYGANDYVLSNVLVREGSSPGTWSGVGTPEAQVAAKVGALYKRRDGGAGTSLYVKESGTSNTGWVAK